LVRKFALRAILFAGLGLVLFVLVFLGSGLRQCGLSGLAILVAQLAPFYLFPITLAVLLVGAVLGTFYDGELRSWRFILAFSALAALCLAGGYLALPGDCSFP
jgi:hypothetical protein